MALISEIIDTLGNPKRSLAAGLLKARAVVRQSAHRDLILWVDCELLGYVDRKHVPLYRRLPADVVANVKRPSCRAVAHAISVLQLAEEQRDCVTCIHLSDAVSALEEFTAGTEKSFVAPVALESQQLVRQLLPEEAGIEKLWVQCDRQSVVDALDAIRARLLNFMVALQKRVGDIEETNSAGMFAAIDIGSLFEHLIQTPNIAGIHRGN